MNIIKNTESSSIVQWDEVDDSLPTTYIVTWTSERDHIAHPVTLIERSSYIITGLTLDTVYTITVTASNKCGDGSEYSTSVLFTTVTTSTFSPTVSASINTMTNTSTPSPTFISAVVDPSTSMTAPVDITDATGTTTKTTIMSTRPASMMINNATNLDNTIATTKTVKTIAVTSTSTVVRNLHTTTTNSVSSMPTTTAGSSIDSTSKLSSTKLIYSCAACP